jgi:O-antigen/teichoic acid export membrane protein
VGGIAALLLGAGVVAVAAVFLSSAVLAFALALFLLVRRVSRVRPEVHPSAWASLMRAAAPIGVAGIFGIVIFRIDTVMLAAYEPNAVVGEYGAAYRLFETTLFLSWAVGAAVYPVLSRSSAPTVGLVYEGSLKLVLALTLPLAAAAATLSEPLVRVVFGSDYAGAGDALALLAPAIALYPISYIAGYLLVSQNRALVLTATYAFVAVENVLLNLVLIPRLSLEGAALGTSISELLAAAILVAYSMRVTGRTAWTRVLAGPVMASSVAAAGMVWLREDLLVAAAAGALAYVAVLTAFERSVFPQDARMLWSSFRPVR